jgi:hypothetical protein
MCAFVVHDLTQAKDNLTEESRAKALEILDEFSTKRPKETAPQWLALTFAEGKPAAHHATDEFLHHPQARNSKSWRSPTSNAHFKRGFPRCSLTSKSSTQTCLSLLPSRISSKTSVRRRLPKRSCLHRNPQIRRTTSGRSISSRNTTHPYDDMPSRWGLRWTTHRRYPSCT